MGETLKNSQGPLSNTYIKGIITGKPLKIYKSYLVLDI